MCTHPVFYSRLCVGDGDKRWQAKAYSLGGWKLSFQLAKHPVIRPIHLSGLSLVATLRARSLCCSLWPAIVQWSRHQSAAPSLHSTYHWGGWRPGTQRQALPCYSPLTVFTSNKLTQTWQGDMRSCLGPEPSSNCHLHQTYTEKGKAKLLLWLQNSLALSRFCLSDRVKDAAESVTILYTATSI